MKTAAKIKRPKRTATVAHVDLCKLTVIATPDCSQHVALHILVRDAAEGRCSISGATKGKAADRGPLRTTWPSKELPLHHDGEDGRNTEEQQEDWQLLSRGIARLCDPDPHIEPGEAQPQYDKRCSAHARSGRVVRREQLGQHKKRRKQQESGEEEEPGAHAFPFGRVTSALWRIVEGAQRRRASWMFP